MHTLQAQGTSTYTVHALFFPSLSPPSLIITHNLPPSHTQFQELLPINRLLSFIFLVIHPSTNSLSHFLPPVLFSDFKITSLLVRLDSAHSSYNEKTPNHYWFCCHEKYIWSIRIQTQSSFCIPIASGHILISSTLFTAGKGKFSLLISAKTYVFWLILCSNSPGPLVWMFMLEISILSPPVYVFHPLFLFFIKHSYSPSFKLSSFSG